MLDSFFIDLAMFLFSNANRLFILLFVFAMIAVVLFWLSFIFIRLQKAILLFLALNFVLFIPLFSFPNLLDQLYLALNLMDEFQTAPGSMRTPVLFISLTTTLALLYLVFTTLTDVISGKPLTSAGLVVESKREAKIANQRFNEELIKGL